MTKALKIFVIVIGLFFTAGCKKFLTAELSQSQVFGDAVFKSDGTAVAAMNGIYHQMKTVGFASGSFNSVMLLTGFSSDEFINYSPEIDLRQFYQNALTPSNTYNLGIWRSAYETIYACNAMLEGVAGAEGISDEVKIQLEGEAKFLRAFAHFYLVNLFGDIPLVLTTDYRINRLVTRTPASEVYQQIIADLLSAQSILSSDYPSLGRVRVNKTVATAMLARVYLFTGTWDKAITQANNVIGDTRYDLESDLNKVFLADSKEAVWQLIDPALLPATREGNILILNSIPATANPAALDSAILNTFTLSDKRRNDWIRSYTAGTNRYYYPYKYKLNQGTGSVNEYAMVIRLAELFLIRAEARVRQGQLIPAIDDLDRIRHRADAPLIAVTSPGISQDDLLLAIENERKLELFSEWGHRWLDLKRTSRANAVLGNKPNWNNTDILYPIPEQELLNDPNLKPQNPGY